MQIVGRPKVGALPVHGYDVPQLGQFWSHSDIDGSFFVISVDAINATAAEVAVRGLAACNLSCQKNNLAHGVLAKNCCKSKLCRLH